MVNGCLPVILRSRVDPHEVQDPFHTLPGEPEGHRRGVSPPHDAARAFVIITDVQDASPWTRRSRSRVIAFASWRQLSSNLELIRFRGHLQQQV